MQRNMTSLELDERTDYRDLAKKLDVHWQTVYRWITRGVTAGPGRSRRVKLRCERRQGKRLVTRRWFEQFVAEQQDDAAVRDEFLTGHESRQQLDKELASN